MLGQPCLVTENIDFVYQNCLEWEKTMGLHPGDIKKNTLISTQKLLKTGEKEVLKKFFLSGH